MKDLREFIENVKEMGELREIKGAHWDMEIGAITYVAATASNPQSLLFDNVQGYPEGYRILTIPDSTEKRMALVLGLPTELRGLDLVRKMRDKLSEPLELLPPVEVKEGPILENVHTGRDIDLFEFPTPKWGAGDAGRYIGTGDTVIERDPDEGWINIGVHRVQIHDKSTATINFDPGKHGGFIRDKYWSRGQSCPVAVTCGGDPFLVSVGGTKIPWGMSEYDYAGWWRKEPVEVIKGPMTGLPIPAHAEIALEGEIVQPEVESRIEGPFSEGTGHYSPAKMCAAFRINSILHRNNPIILGQLPFLAPGVPMGALRGVKAAEVWSHLDSLVPGVTAVWAPPELPGSIVISIEQKYGGHAKQVALAALGKNNYGQKYVIVVDDDIDPSNICEVLFALSLRADPTKFDIIRDTWCNRLTPLLSPWQREVDDITQSAVLILACKPYYWINDFPPRVRTDPNFAVEINKKWQIL